LDEIQKNKLPVPTQDEYQEALKKSYSVYGIDPKQAYEDHKKEIAKMDAAREAANAAHERANQAQGLENVWYTLANMRGGRASDALANSAIAGQKRVDEQRSAEEAYQQQNLTNMMKQQAVKQALDDAQVALARGDFKGYQDAKAKAQEINASRDNTYISGLGHLATNWETNQTRRENAAESLAMRKQLAQNQQQQHEDTAKELDFKIRSGQATALETNIANELGGLDKAYANTFDPKEKARIDARRQALYKVLDAAREQVTSNAGIKTSAPAAVPGNRPPLSSFGG